MRRLPLIILAAAAAAACGDKREASPAPPGTAANPAAAPGTPGAPTPDPLRTVPVTEVPATVKVDPVPPGTLVVVTPREVVTDGVAVVQVADGALDDPRGRLATWTAAWAKATAADARAINLAIAPALPAPLVLDVLRPFTHAGATRAALVVRSPDGPGAVPLHLASPTAAAPDPAEPALQMRVALTGEHAAVWSGSGLEGTLPSPLVTARLDDPAWTQQVRDRLAEVARRRWAGRARPPASREIVLLAGRAATAGNLVALAVAVRHAADGAELFPEIILATELDAAPPAAASDTAPPVSATSPAAPVSDTTRRPDDPAAAYAQMLSNEEPADRPGGDLRAQIEADRRDGEHRVEVGTPATRGPLPPGKVTFVGVRALDDTTLTGPDVQRKVASAYSAGLTRCYRQALVGTPDARGRATIAFTVNEQGRATGAKVTSSVEAITACITGQVGAWRFPVPRDGAGEAATAAVEVSVALVPGP